MPPSTKRRAGNTKSLIRTERQKEVKIKGPYFLSVARDSHLTNKPKAINARILSPSLSISVPFYGYLKLLKATRKGRKSKEGFVITHGNRTRDLP